MCTRCVSTGRVCEGYGIWGGGGNQLDRRSVRANSSTSLTGFYAPTLLHAVSKEESRSLEWFTYRTAFKLPGAFRFDFWDSLLFQAISNETAVLQAVLALSSAHKAERFTVAASDAEPVPDEQEQRTLRHYSKAISSLQPHLFARNHSSTRVALITCLVFIIMEFLRGHYRTGNLHLQIGLRLLNESQARSSAIDNYSLFLESCSNSVDASIIQAFIRFDVQAKFLGHGSEYLDLMGDDYTSEIPSPSFTFQSNNQARQHLDRLLSQIFFLTNKCRGQELHLGRIYPSANFLDQQKRIKASLAAWHQAFKVSTAVLKDKKVNTNMIAYLILHVYYRIAKIMADTCVWLLDESRYDMHTREFESIMEQVKQIRTYADSPTTGGIGHFSDMTNSVSDLGALPAVYYVAVKCRVHRIRHDALEFLDGMTHKEGIWSAPLSTCVAREVIKMEEGDFYNETHGDNDVTLYSDSNKEGPDPPPHQPTLLGLYRLHDVEIDLPEGYGGSSMVKYKRRLHDCTWEIIEREYVYDMPTNSWLPK